MKFKKLDEALIKMRVAYAYFLENKSLEELKDMGDYDPYSDQLHKMNIKEKETMLFMINQKHGKKVFYYFVSKYVLEAMKGEFGSKISMIYTDPKLMTLDKPLHFYKVTVKKNKRRTQEQLYKIQHLNAKGKVLNWRDWDNYKDQCLEQHEPGLKYKTQSKNTKFNEQLKSACVEIMNIVLLKTKLDIRKIKFDFAINDRMQVYLLDTTKISVYDKSIRDIAELGGAYPDVEHMNKFVENIREMNEKKDGNCFGIYCDIKRNLHDQIIDDKEELNNLYLMKENDKENYHVEYKSILLDIVERYKTIERVRKNCPKLTKQQVEVDVSEGLLFKFRKYYMIADIQYFGLFCHMNFPNFYEQRKVCSFCKTMYTKIDNFRVTKKNEKNAYQKDKGQIQKEIERVFQDTNSNLNKRINKEKERFSKTFYKDQEFNHMIALNENPVTNLSLGSTNHKPNFHTYKSHNHQPNSYKPVNVKIVPKIDYDIQGRYEKMMVNREKAKKEAKDKKRNEAIMNGSNKGMPSVNVNKNDQLSLRFHLGSSHEVPIYEHGCISTKSSIDLTGLQEQVNRLEKIAHRNTHIKLPMNDKEFYDLIMCPYYGQGKRNTTQLKNFMKNRSQANLKPGYTDLKVTLDRLKFMDSQEVKKQLDPDLSKRIKAKEEKENLERKLAEEEEQLLGNNAKLAASVLKEVKSEIGLLGLDDYSNGSPVRRSKNVFKVNTRTSLNIKY